MKYQAALQQYMKDRRLTERKKLATNARLVAARDAKGRLEENKLLAKATSDSADLLAKTTHESALTLSKNDMISAHLLAKTTHESAALLAKTTQESAEQLRRASKSADERMRWLTLAVVVVGLLQIAVGLTTLFIIIALE